MTARTIAAARPTALLCCALLLAMFASGCQKDAAEEAEAATAAAPATETAAEPAPAAETRATETPPPAPVPGTDAAIVEDHATPVAAAPSFDAKAFAGRYAAGETALEITDDGMFALTVGGTAIDGTWTLQPGGKTVTLDPDSKSETDRQLEIVSADTVSLAGTALKRVADTP